MEKDAKARVVMAGIQKKYSGVPVLCNVDFSVLPGEIHALLGHNGAGKSTLIKILTGIVHADGGEIWIDGEKVHITSPRDSENYGIRVVHQEKLIFPNLDVAHNIFLNELPRSKRFSLLEDRVTLYQKTRQILNSIGISNISPEQSIEELNPAQQRMVEIARALALSARVLVLDEVTASLSAKEVEELFKIIRQLRSGGCSIIYITHRLDEVFSLTDRVTVLREGKLVGTYNTGDLTKDKLVEYMVGSRVTPPAEVRKETEGREDSDVVLQIENLSAGIIRDISFEIRQGEIVGLAGMVGSGRSTIARVLFGLQKKQKGTIRLGGKSYEPRHPKEALKAGVGLVPEDRKRQGLLLDQSIVENIILAFTDNLDVGGIRRVKQEEKVSLEAVTKYKIKYNALCQLVKSLSGGNQQKVVLARWLLRNLKVLILDEPTVGVDVGTRRQIHELVRHLAKEVGTGILVISTDPEDLVAMCDRIIVLRGGYASGTIKVTPETRKEDIDWYILMGSERAAIN